MQGNAGTEWIDIIRVALFLSLFLAASITDLKKRIVPDSICIGMVLVSFLPPEPERMLGICAALPFLLVGMTVGGIGGGDIKLVGAAGMVLGFWNTIVSLIPALCGLLCFHIARSVLQKRKKQEKKKEQAYPLVPFLFLGTIITLWIGG